MRRMTLLVTALLTAVPPTPARAQLGIAGTIAGAFIAGNTVKSIIETLRQAARQMLDNAADAGKVITFNAATNALTVLDGVEKTLGGSVNDTIDNIDDATYNALRGVAASIQLGESALLATLDRSEDLINQVNSLVGTLPFAAGQVGLTSYRPFALHPSFTGGRVPLTLRGHSLDRGNVRVRVREPGNAVGAKVYYEITTKPDGEVSYTTTVPGNALPFAETTSNYVEIDFTFQQRRSLFERLSNMRTFKDTAREVTFTKSYLLLPRLLGRAEFTSKYQEPKTESEPQQQWVGINAKGDCKSYTIRPRLEGRRIDERPRLEDVRENRGNGEITEYDGPSGRFVVRVCANRVSSWGRTYDGYYHAYARWNENWTSYTEKRDVQTKDVPFAGDTAFEVNHPNDIFYVTMKTFDGASFTLTRQPVSGAYFSSTYDPQAQLMIVSGNTTRLRSLLGL